MRKRQTDRTLATQIIDLVGRNPAHDLKNAAEIGRHGRMDGDFSTDAQRRQITEAGQFRIARRAMHGVAPVQQQPGQIGAVLAGNAEYQSGPRRVHRDVSNMASAKSSS